MDSAFADMACALNMDADTLGRALVSTGLLEFQHGLSQAEFSDWLSAFQPFHDAAAARPLNVSRPPCADPGESCTSSSVHRELKEARCPCLCACHAAANNDAHCEALSAS